MTSDDSSIVIFASAQFWPFAHSAPSSGSSSSPSASSPGAASQATAARRLFAKWVHENAQHFNCDPTTAQPSHAALLVFALVNAHRSASSKLCVNVTVEESASAARVDIGLRPKDLQLGAVARAFEPQRRIFWHILEQTKGTFRESSWERDTCGFLGCGGACLPVQDAAARRAFHLETVFKKSTRESGTLAESQPSVNSPRRRPRSRSYGLIDLPNDVLFRVVLLLEPSDVAALSNTCLTLRKFLEPVVPGLKLRLFPHQVSALTRMLTVEKRSKKDRPLPLVHRFSLPGYSGACVVLDQVDGSVLCLTEMPLVPSPRGGLFCDEPGLGKTITALSVILKSLGQTPKPPAGIPCQIIQSTGWNKSVMTYQEPLEGRFRSFGDDATRKYRSRRSVMLPFATEHQQRSSNRQVRQPDFLNKDKGGGSVPFVQRDADVVTIYLTHATLIVVPNMLTQHWLTQIRQHVAVGRLRVLHLRSTTDLDIDMHDLATNYDVVLASFESIGKLIPAGRAYTPLLMRLHFLRIIVDEGHSLSSSNITQFSSACNRLRAERRWVMTGTPTPSTLRSDVDHLHSLLKFIGEEGYGYDKKTWAVGIREPYSRYHQESLDRLEDLLSDVMIRADKSILSSRCHVKNVILDFDEEAAKSYNWLVSLTRRNLLTSDWFSEKHKESLLNGKNISMAQLTVTNLRQVCCFGGTQITEFTEEDVVHTLDELYERFYEQAKVEPNDRFEDPTTQTPFLLIRDESDESSHRADDVQARLNLYEELRRNGTKYVRLTKKLKKPMNGKTLVRRIYSGILYDIGESFLDLSSRCAKCYSFTPIPIVTPCAHLLCEECTITDKNACPVPSCRIKYRLDKAGIPEELIELQPSAYSPHGWKQNWVETKSVKMEYLLDRIENLPLNEEWVAGLVEPVRTRPKVIIHTQFKEHLFGAAIALDQRPLLRHAYIEMGATNREEDLRSRRSKKVSEYAQECIRQFSEDPNKFILLMSTKQGSVGLDLSFVQYIFLLEPVWDASVELQIVSRAHRIGSKGDIYVERLVMRNSVEHEMLHDLEKKLGMGLEMPEPGDGKGRGPKDLSRVRSILRNLRPVTAAIQNTSGDPQSRHSGGDQSQQMTDQQDQRTEEEQNRRHEQAALVAEQPVVLSQKRSLEDPGNQDATRRVRFRID